MYTGGCGFKQHFSQCCGHKWQRQWSKFTTKLHVASSSQQVKRLLQNTIRHYLQHSYRPPFNITRTDPRWSESPERSASSLIAWSRLLWVPLYHYILCTFNWRYIMATTLLIMLYNWGVIHVTIQLCVSILHKDCTWGGCLYFDLPIVPAVQYISLESSSQFF